MNALDRTPDFNPSERVAKQLDDAISKLNTTPEIVALSRVKNALAVGMGVLSPEQNAKLGQARDLLEATPTYQAWKAIVEVHGEVNRDKKKE